MNPSSLTIFLSALLALGEAVGADLSPAIVPLQCATTAQSFTLPSDGSDLHFRIEDDASWLEIEESGQQVTASGVSGAINIPQPLRYGWHWVPAHAQSLVSVSRYERESRAPGKIVATLHCAVTPQLQAFLGWLPEAGRLGEQLDTPTDQEHLSLLLDALRALADSAPDPTTHAIALHFQAEALAANDRAEASQAFAATEQAWSTLRDRNRALAARVGHVEGLRSSDTHQAVVDITPDVSTLHGEQTYFSVRQENSRCLSLQSLGRRDAAGACFKWMLANYQALDERAEFVVAAQNYAGLLRDQGNLQAAEDLGVQSLGMVSGVDAPMVRGRLRLMLADIATRRGQPTQSLAHAKLALDEFSHAQGGAWRWRANALLYIAILYSELGADDEAYAMLDDAVRLLAPLNAPSRMAVAMNVFADIETNTRNFDQALWWRHAAEETYARLGMATARSATRTLRLELQAQRGDIASVKRALSEPAASDPLRASMMLLLQAELALDENRMLDARAALGELRAKPLSVHDQIHLTLLEADYRDRSADTAGAQQVLLDAGQRIEALAQRARSPVLRYVIARQELALRRMAMRLALSHAPATGDASAIDAIWAWLALDATGTDTANGNMPGNAEQFDRAVAAELLTPETNAKTSAEATAQHELLSLLAQPEREAVATKSTLPTIPLAALQQRLAVDAALVAYLDGDVRGALLWVTRDSVRLVDAAAPDQVQSGAIALRTLLQSPGSSVADIHNASGKLSAQLFGALPASPPPGHLYVLVNDSSNGIAWSTLTWPGRIEPLLDSTAVSLIRLAASAADAESLHLSASTPKDLRIVVATQQEANTPSLPDLAGASVEATQIRSAFADHDVSIDENAHATRNVVLSALGATGAWVHVAAHGSAQPQRIGYAGIWLEPTAPDTAPAFLSWLDILDHGVNADLVVLNACRLGDSGNAINGNLSFAAAVSRAGAKKVVAALWPVSDSASSLWVPAFYSALAADPEYDAAEALRVAQLRLRASRAFAHPFFWAGMQALERMPIAVAPPAMADPQASISASARAH